jgi:hypothetical protein
MQIFLLKHAQDNQDHDGLRRLSYLPHTPVKMLTDGSESDSLSYLPSKRHSMLVCPASTALRSSWVLRPKFTRSTQLIDVNC